MDEKHKDNKKEGKKKMLNSRIESTSLRHAPPATYATVMTHIRVIGGGERKIVFVDKQVFRRVDLQLNTVQRPC